MNGAVRAGGGVRQMWPVGRGQAVRLAQGARSRARPQRWWDVEHGPRDFAGVDVLVRPPLLADGSLWCRARLANQARLEDSFSRGDAWAREQNRLAWTERCLGLRRAARRGLAFPRVIVAVRDGRPHELLGEFGVDSIDTRTLTGEVSGWSSAAMPSHWVIRWAAGGIILRAFSGPRPLLRMVAPFAVANRGPETALRLLGFRPELTLTKHRVYDGRPADHHVFVLHNTPRSREQLAELVQAPDPGATG